MPDYKVQFDVFEGPLDLLLYLVKKEEVDIYEVNLTKIAREFIEYVELMREFDLEVAGEFLVMASTLVYIKSRELLPVDQQAVDDTDEEGEDPRWELIRKLVEYKKFKDAAERLETIERAQENIYPRLPVAPTLDNTTPAPRTTASLFDLIGAVNEVLRRFQLRETQEIFAEQWTVGGKITDIRTRLATASTLKFYELFADASSRQEVVATFLAILELVRLRQLDLVQEEDFAEIVLCRSAEFGDGGNETGVAPATVMDME
ncbi:MAG: chromosome segregation protein ScpA [Pedosphaera sp.]|nr:chromosome segregation protein ScpA [Pedosphaera sp.]